MISNQSESNSRILTRDTAAVLIPVGTPIMLPGGTPVEITQSLGHSYTVNIHGNLARIAAQDADALGEETKSLEFNIPVGESLTTEHIYDILKTCYDPEIPVNIVDLGLIYDVQIETLENNQYNIRIDMTLTAPGCGIGPFLVEEMQAKLQSITEVQHVHIELVFDPPWNQDMLSDAAKLQLGLF